MRNYYTPISSAEYKRIIEKDSLITEDVKQISKFIPPSLEKEFNTKLKPIERDEICKLVCRNIYTILRVYNSLIQNDGKYDHLITKEYLKMCSEEVGNDESKLIPLKAAFIFANGSGGTYKFSGKIPKRGLFSDRQSIANLWADKFIKHFGWHIISPVLDKTGNNKELTFVAIAEFTACFLVNTYPHEFDSRTSARDIIVDLSKM